MDALAERYVRLTLALGLHDPNYVDAYYGPPEWNDGAELPLKEIAAQASDLQGELGQATPSGELEELRKQYLAKQLGALQARVSMLQGRQWKFDEESAALYDVVAPERPDSFYQAVLDRLAPLLPGDGPLSERYDRLRSQFYIPRERLSAVFQAAMDAARERTRRHIDLDPNETFETEYVRGEVWSAYNWYKGSSHSLIQINTDLPITIDRAVGLVCHEGYPGHHVYNALLEQHLAKGRGWKEFTVYALYSPQSLIAEGTAEYGVELNYPKEERLQFEKSVLYPLAGLDAGRAEEYSQVLECIGQLRYSSNEAARRYLDGLATREETADWLIAFSLATPERAEQRIRFIEAHRSYVVTYNVGEDLVRSYVESRASSPVQKWDTFVRLLWTPQFASNLG